MRIHPSCSHVNTMVWLHYLDSNETLGKKLDQNYTRMLPAVLNKSWKQHLTKWLLYGHLLPILQIIQIRRVRHAGHCWRNKDELISNVLL